MYRNLICLAIILLWMPSAWADELKPPVPLNTGDGMDVLPPPLDLDQLTPVSLPAASNAVTGPSAQAQSILKVLDESQSTPTPAVVKTPALVPTPTMAAAALTPTPSPETKKNAAAVPVASLGLFAEYFPTLKGTKWSYEYLKAAPGEEAKKIRSVECLAQETSSDGSLQATFQVNDQGKTVLEKYSLSGGKVTHTFTDDQALTDDFVFQFPAKGAVARWMGGGNYFKASFGQAQVYQKIYPDCVIVTEKTKSSTIISYYARGKGLVAVEVYGKGLKLDQAKSTALLDNAEASK